MAAMAIMWTETWQLLRCFIFSILESTGPIARDFGFSVAAPFGPGRAASWCLSGSHGTSAPHGASPIPWCGRGHRTGQWRPENSPESRWEIAHWRPTSEKICCRESAKPTMVFFLLKPTELSVPTCSNGSTPMIWSSRDGWEGVATPIIVETWRISHPNVSPPNHQALFRAYSPPRAPRAYKTAGFGVVWFFLVESHDPTYHTYHNFF